MAHACVSALMSQIPPQQPSYGPASPPGYYPSYPPPKVSFDSFSIAFNMLRDQLGTWVLASLYALLTVFAVQAPVLVAYLYFLFSGMDQMMTAKQPPAPPVAFFVVMGVMFLVMLALQPL